MKKTLLIIAALIAGLVSSQAGLILVGDNCEKDQGLGGPKSSGDKWIMQWVTALVNDYAGDPTPPVVLTRDFKINVEDGPKSWNFPVAVNNPDFLVIHYGGGKTCNNYQVYDLRDPMDLKEFEFPEANNGLSWYAGYSGPAPGRNTIPEPGTYAMGGLLVAGFAGAGLFRRRRSRK